MTLKERIEDNLTLYTLSLLLVGFLAGIGTYKFLLDLNAPMKNAEGECKAELWKAEARKNRWISVNECPAFSLDAKITSPGDNSSIDVDSAFDSRLNALLIITANHPLPAKADVGLVVKPSNEDNFYVVFPSFDSTEPRTTFRNDIWLNVPFRLRPNTTLEVRPLVVDDKKNVGNNFSNIEQIKNSDSSVFIGNPATLKLR